MSSKTKAEDEQSWESPFLIMLLPEEVIVDIIARVRRCDYPALSLVSKHFRSLVDSSELYVRRSLLGCTEHCLYVLLRNTKTWEIRWYILNNNRRLVPIPWLPDMLSCRSFIAVGSKIYVFGEIDNHRLCKLSIDCRSHKVQTLPSMPIPFAATVAGIIL
ncbi:unnamed protein product [Microthlaspi erraticum]|uniref:F-box domain-containing protein n=1 Tax=Microthlaspi erraticum TaxID=1685480 RepID=A0A6D2JE69_9BRAS|nr:unnamed protein product [Microthlaspi erraticum]